MDRRSREGSDGTRGTDGMTCLRSRSPLKQRAASGSRSSSRLASALGPTTAPSKDTLLATLPGHNNAITDMKYSSAGDRILTASMKDGVVRLWSWGRESATIVDGSGHTNATNTSDFQRDIKSAKFGSLYQVMIRLTRGNSSGALSNAASARGTPSHRRGTSAAAAGSLSVYCDGAAWLCDDSKVVTSQSCPLKATGSEIVPESQMLYVWDSRTGRCLMGVLSPHVALCSTLAPHPTVPSILATAGSDGVVNVWDFEAGRRITTHRNELLHGPADLESQMTQGNVGYLDAQFSPDGLYLVCSDETGRVTIFDTLAAPGTHPDDDADSAPAFMKEQYFGNDYYDLAYDEHGYCVERGSGEPPHRAPRSVRCCHNGTAYADEAVLEAYRKLKGPVPLPEEDCRWERDVIRARSTEVRKDGGVLCRNVVGKRAFIITQSVGSIGGCRTAAIITPDGRLVLPGWKGHGVTNDAAGGHQAPSTNNTRTTTTGRTLSNRYRWRRDDDVMEEDDFGDDNDDEDYEETARGTGRSLRDTLDEDDDNQSSESEDDVDNNHNSSRSRGRPRGRGRGILSSESEDDRGNNRNPSRPRRQSPGQRRSHNRASTSGRPSQQNRRSNRMASVEEPVQNQPTRASSRHAARRLYEVVGSSDDEMVTELMSTNTAPSSSDIFIDDWNIRGHYFRMPRGADVQRKWLTRNSNQTNLIGNHAYCPQVGDSIVYIPRAHYDIIQKFPTGGQSGPWKSWSHSSPWSVVKCTVKSIRYRFPYEEYYRSRRTNDRVRSVVAILTLEITGIPLQSSERSFPWPSPNFISTRTRSQNLVFDVSMFESDQGEFILPEHLYTWRIRELERAIHANGGVSGIRAVVHFPPSEEGDDGYGTEDPKFLTYPCTLLDINQSEDENEFHFQNSGYNAVSLSWAANSGQDSDEVIHLSAWDITLENIYDKKPSGPYLDTCTKKAIKTALDEIKRNQKVKTYLYFPVDSRRYSDYFDMIEVPTCLSNIYSRLGKGYYSNKRSVLADVELLCGNCIKYNEEGNDLFAIARRMVEQFESLVDDIEEPEISQPENPPQPAEKRSDVAATSNQPARNGDAQSSQSRARQTSSLESLQRLDETDTRDAGVQGEDEHSVEINQRASRSSRARSHQARSQLTESATHSRRQTDSSASGRSDDGENEGVDGESEGSNDESEEHSVEVGDSAGMESLNGSPEPQNGNSSNDEVESDGCDQDSSEDDNETSRKKRRTRRTAANESTDRSTRNVSGENEKTNPHPNPSVPTRRASSRANNNKPTYAEKESDGEFVDDDEESASKSSDNESENDFSSLESDDGRGPKKRKASPNNNPSKRGKKSGDLYYPDLPKWPDIPEKKLIVVAASILEKMDKKDTDRLFAIPVAEEFPTLADSYLLVVKQPMDFRTIEEDRAPHYESIGELQDDLILVFQNCCAYNGVGSKFYFYSEEMWKDLNKVFRDTCTEHRLRLPRGW